MPHAPSGGGPRPPRPSPAGVVLAQSERGPFTAVELVAGDLGTKGGLVTDEHGRVLTEDDSAIPGLYGSGNCTASVMGRTYPGPGSTLGPAVVFGVAAARHATARRGDDVRGRAAQDATVA